MYICLSVLIESEKKMEMCKETRRAATASGRSDGGHVNIQNK